jgi:NADH dehydrogenase/NADH:ubiquinone reductase (non-electrogenic)
MHSLVPSNVCLNWSRSKKGIVVRTGTAVTEVAEIPLCIPSAYWSIESITITVARLADHTELPFGCLVWSAGLAPVKLISNLPASLKRGPGGRLAVDPYLRVPGTHGRVFALGDCAATTLDGDDNSKAIGALPPTASVAEQQAQYLADCFNETYANSSEALTAKSSEDLAVDGLCLPAPAPVYPGVMPFDFPPFVWLNRFYSPSSTFHYVNRGAMASLGSRQGVADLTKTGMKGAPNIAIGTGTFSSAAALAIWRGTYTFKQLSWSNTLLIPMYWLKTWVFGRDISRF